MEKEKVTQTDPIKNKQQPKLEQSKPVHCCVPAHIDIPLLSTYLEPITSSCFDIVMPYHECGSTDHVHCCTPQSPQLSCSLASCLQISDTVTLLILHSYLPQLIDNTQSLLEITQMHKVMNCTVAKDVDLSSKRLGEETFTTLQVTILGKGYKGRECSLRFQNEKQSRKISVWKRCSICAQCLLQYLKSRYGHHIATTLNCSTEKLAMLTTFEVKKFVHCSMFYRSSQCQASSF